MSPCTGLPHGSPYAVHRSGAHAGRQRVRRRVLRAQVSLSQALSLRNDRARSLLMPSSAVHTPPARHGKASMRSMQQFWRTATSLHSGSRCIQTRASTASSRAVRNGSAISSRRTRGSNVSSLSILQAEAAGHLANACASHPPQSAFGIPSWRKSKSSRSASRSASRPLRSPRVAS